MPSGIPAVRYCNGEITSQARSPNHLLVLQHLCDRSSHSEDSRLTSRPSKRTHTRIQRKTTFVDTSLVCFVGWLATRLIAHTAASDRAKTSTFRMELGLRSTMQTIPRSALRWWTCPQCSPQQRKPTLYQRREYSATSSRSGRGGKQPRAPQIHSLYKSHLGESTGTKMTKATKKDTPTDLGLFPGTMIAKPFSEYLSVLRTDPRLWFKVQWALGKKSIWTFLQ
jgi:hypothetical protein